jgi:hypothetical protein
MEEKKLWQIRTDIDATRDWDNESRRKNKQTKLKDRKKQRKNKQTK